MATAAGATVATGTAAAGTAIATAAATSKKNEQVREAARVEGYRAGKA